MASTERLHHATSTIIGKTSEVDLELHDRYGRRLDKPDGSQAEMGGMTAHTAP